GLRRCGFRLLLDSLGRRRIGSAGGGGRRGTCERDPPKQHARSISRYGAGVRAWLFVLLAACGDNADPCSYRERANNTNDQTAEATGVVVGGRPREVCGSIDTGNDVDTYRVTVGGSGELEVQIIAEQGVELLDAVDVRIFDTSSVPRLVATGRYAQGHGA